MPKPCPHCGEPVGADLFYGGSGRKPSCTEEVTEAMCQAIRDTGCPDEVAAELADVSRRTFWNWKAWGESGREPYAAFLQRVARARAEWHQEALRKLEDVEATCQDVRAAAAVSASIRWKLTKLIRDIYGEQVTVKVEQAKENMVETLASVFERHGLSMDVLGEVVSELDGATRESRTLN